MDANMDEKKSVRVFEYLRDNFLYGLVVILPIFATIWFVQIVVSVISGPISVILGHRIPSIVSFFISISLLFFIGVIARNFLGKIILNFLDALFEKTPLIRIIYKSSKQIMMSFSFKKNKHFMRSVLVEYPKKDMWAIAFITQKNSQGLTSVEGQDVSAGKVALFLPTTPNPTSGYFLYVDKSAIIELDMTVEESIKLVMSAGVVNPIKGKS